MPSELEGGDHAVSTAPALSAVSLPHNQTRSVEQRSTFIHRPEVETGPGGHAVVPEKDSGAAANVSCESETHTRNKAATDDPRDAQIRSLKRNVVENVQMIRKMFSIEQELRKELDDVEAENDTLSVRNRQLEEGQERLRERISILESVVVASAAAAHEHKARGVEAETSVVQSTPGRFHANNNTIGPPSTQTASSVSVGQQKQTSPPPQAVERADSNDDDPFDDLMTPTAANIAAHKTMRRSSTLDTDTTSAATSPEHRRKSPVLDFRGLRVQPNKPAPHAARGPPVERLESPVTGPKSSSSNTALEKKQRQFTEQRQLSAPASSSATLGPATAVRANAAGMTQPSTSCLAVPITKASARDRSRSKAAAAVANVEAGKLAPSQALANLLKSRAQAHPANGKSHSSRQQSAHLLSRLADSSESDSDFDNASDPTDDGDGLLSVGDLQQLLMGNTTGLRQKLGQSKSTHRKPKAGDKGSQRFNKSTGGPRKPSTRKKGAVKKTKPKRPHRYVEWTK
eukprot:INCI1492.2.p2 GENE.INCI1492.2~~INCI1492.2.p2  ORF type:complete len:515 (-),score=95.41 INCI1492.2:28-1572(-)